MCLSWLTDMTSKHNVPQSHVPLCPHSYPAIQIVQKLMPWVSEWNRFIFTTLLSYKFPGSLGRDELLIVLRAPDCTLPIPPWLLPAISHCRRANGCWSGQWQRHLFSAGRWSKEASRPALRQADVAQVRCRTGDMLLR